MSGATAPIIAQDVSVHGQVRPRIEGRSTGDGTSTDFTSMRVRASVRAALPDAVTVVVELQDVRIFGEERNTLTDFRADNFDLHQGYLEVGFGAERSTTARVGRQETSFGGERLIGTVGWTQQGRSFDGARITTARDQATIDVVAYKLAESSATAVDTDGELYGAYGVVGVGETQSLDLFVLHNRMTGALPTRQSTVGARFHGTRDQASFRIEGSAQRGERSGADVSAFMMGARVGTAFAAGRSAVHLWYDYLSGDDDPGDGTTRVFDTLFATNHKFYGLADLFLNIPTQTGGLGLQDMALKASHRLHDRARLNVAAHNFRLAQQGPLSGPGLGQELDLTLTLTHSTALGVTAGYSRVFVGDALIELGRFSEDVNFGYVMLDARF